jgi:hypothetical protein
MYDTYHHYIYLWYPLVLCPVDFSERASAECAWGSSTTASFPEKKCGESKSNASVYSDLPIYIYTIIYVYTYIQCIQVQYVLLKYPPAGSSSIQHRLQTLRTDGRSGRPVPPCLRVWLMDCPPVVTSHHLLAWFSEFIWFYGVFECFFWQTLAEFMQKSMQNSWFCVL